MVGYHSATEICQKGERETENTKIQVSVEPRACEQIRKTCASSILIASSLSCLLRPRLAYSWVHAYLDH